VPLTRSLTGSMGQRAIREGDRVAEAAQVNLSTAVVVEQRRPWRYFGGGGVLIGLLSKAGNCLEGKTSKNSEIVHVVRVAATRDRWTRRCLIFNAGRQAWIDKISTCALSYGGEFERKWDGDR